MAEMTRPHEDLLAELRPLMFAIAYRMLGSVSEAEDIVQEASLRVLTALRGGMRIESPEAYATTVATRLAIDELRSARARREQYVGEWIPEPLLLRPEQDDPARHAEMADSLSLALLVVLERLPPEQRAVFLLREVFDYGYPEIAVIVGRREEGLRVPAKRRKRLSRGDSTVPGDRLRAERPDHVWAFDFQWGVTEDGRAVKLLCVVGELTPDALAMEAERRIDGDKVIEVLDGIIAQQSRRPQLVSCDYGPRRSSTWQPVGEPVRRKLQQPRPRRAAPRRGVLLPDRRQSDDRGLRVDYNRSRPHRAHAMMTPAAFAANLRHSLLRPTATAAGEGIKQRQLLTSAGSDPQPAAFGAGHDRVLLRRSPTARFSPAATKATVGASRQPPSSHDRWTDERGPTTRRCEHPHWERQVIWLIAMFTDARARHATSG